MADKTDRQVVLRAPGVLAVEPAPTITVGPGEIEVRVLATGVCRTDVHIVSGADPIELPRVLGHEVSGWVDGLGAVVLYGSFGCRACADCAVGEEQLCSRARYLGRTTDGGFADRVIVPGPSYCIPIGNLDPADAAPLADAGLTAYRAVTRSKPWLRPGGAVLVLGGGGGLGRFAVQLLRELTDSAILIAEVDERRLAAALALAPDRTVAFTGTASASDGADAVLDFVGSAATLRVAAANVRDGGTIVVVGSEHEDGGLQVALRPEVTVVHSIWGSLPELVELVALGREGRLQLGHEALSLEGLETAVRRLSEGAVTERLVVIP